MVGRKVSIVYEPPAVLSRIHSLSAARNRGWSHTQPSCLRTPPRSRPRNWISSPPIPPEPGQRGATTAPSKWRLPASPPVLPGAGQRIGNTSGASGPAAGTKSSGVRSISPTGSVRLAHPLLAHRRLAGVYGPSWREPGLHSVQRRRDIRGQRSDGRCGWRHFGPHDSYHHRHDHCTHRYRGHGNQFPPRRIVGGNIHGVRQLGFPREHRPRSTRFRQPACLPGKMPEGLLEFTQRSTESLETGTGLSKPSSMNLL